jgi:hypothetical protein
MLWQVLSDKQCGRIPGGNILSNSYSRELLRDAAGCTRFLPYKDVIQVEFQSTQPNPVFCPMVPLKAGATPETARLLFAATSEPREMAWKPFRDRITRCILESHDTRRQPSPHVLRPW